MSEVALAAEQQATHFFLKLLDGAAERWLADMALFGGAREVQRIANGQKVFHMMHIHAGRLRLVRPWRPMTFRHGFETRRASMASKR